MDANAVPEVPEVVADFEPEAVTAPAPLVEIEDLSRSFGETRALVCAALAVAHGEIHALVGENGSGKSTLIKILAGVLRSDSGEIRWEGRPARFTSPESAQVKGIFTVFQEILVVPELSVRDNIFVGTEGTFRHSQSRREESGEARTALDELGLEGIDLDRPLRTLSLAERQLVTVARVTVRPWRLLILDEATSALDTSQRDRLFEYLKRWRALGKSILFTSHRMDEVRLLADTVSVLRQGSTIATLRMTDTTPRNVLRLMAGRESAVRASDGSERRRTTKSGAGDGVDLVSALRVEELVVRPGAKAFSVSVGHGEILGIAGLEGQGQVEFVECLCGLRKPVSGSIVVADEASGWRTFRDFGEANRYGIAYVPRDRKQEGLFYALSTLDNFGMALLGTHNRLGFVKWSTIARRFNEYAELLRLKYGPPRDAVASLSGGNQQKVLLGRWLATRPRVLVLNDPLRGVDAVTKEDLYEVFRKLAADGLTIVLLSSEILELLELCDRVAVLHDAGLQTVLEAAGRSETDVVSAMFGRAIEPGTGD